LVPGMNMLGGFPSMFPGMNMLGGFPSMFPGMNMLGGFFPGNFPGLNMAGGFFPGTFPGMDMGMMSAMQMQMYAQQQMMEMQMQLYQNMMQAQQRRLQNYMAHQRVMASLTQEMYTLMFRIQQVQMAMMYDGYAPITPPGLGINPPGGYPAWPPMPTIPPGGTQPLPGGGSSPVPRAR
ncbi:MAG: hypothetical protein NZ480_00675, partial [Bdellovibrionaceae bacterium]|nr:hypothetical protein [Pseudobdellovibrionaceae bacterium]